MHLSKPAFTYLNIFKNIEAKDIKCNNFQNGITFITSEKFSYLWYFLCRTYLAINALLNACVHLLLCQSAECRFCLSDGCSENIGSSVLNDESCSQTSSQTSCPAHAHIIQPWPLSSGRCLYHRPGTLHEHRMKTVVVCAPVKSLLPHAYIWVMAVSSCLPSGLWCQPVQGVGGMLKLDRLWAERLMAF